MPRKKDDKSTGESPKRKSSGTGPILEQKITKTLETNFMPYAMSIIISRAIPEIDGFKPSHRKILYTMYKMGLLGSQRTKSANVVGQTMRLNPHGDMAIYDTLVRLSRGYEALLHPYIDSKGNFGKAYSRDMAFAASRYTEVRLDPICSELFGDIDHETVEFVDNYDSTMKEPLLLPVSFPSILVNANTGIAVGMASNICSFNLAEVCETAIKLIKSPEHDILSTLTAPDFSGGGMLLYDRQALENIYSTGRGSFKVRARYNIDKAGNCIEITEIPPTTTIEAIIDKIIDLVKSGKIREISDIRDETDLSGLKITIDLKRGTDAEKLMLKLFRYTPLEDSFSCNFNVLIGGTPRVMGIGEILREWTAFRTQCVRNRIYFDFKRYSEKLHLLKGLSKILLNIDKAIRIIRETDEESEVVPNLMIGFGIDKEQAEFVAEIKLRHLNREYILKRTDEIEGLERDIADLKEKLNSNEKIHDIIIGELRDVIKKFGKPRKTLILYDVPNEAADLEDDIPDYPVNIFVTRDGYFKKITPQSLRMSGEQKLKEGDEVALTCETTNLSEILFFTDKQQVYKARIGDFEDTKASQLGEYIPARLSFDEGESLAFTVVTTDYSGFLLLFFQNGKAAKIDFSSYSTKTNRKKLIGAYSGASPLVCAFYDTEDKEYLLTSSSGRFLIVHSGAVAVKTTRTSQGIAAMTLKKGQYVLKAERYTEGTFKNPHRFRVRSLPGTGMMPKSEDIDDQQIKF